MTKEFAKQECIKKWQYIVDNDGFVAGFYELYPDFKNYKGLCPYCELYNKDGCDSCPLIVRNTNTYEKITCNDGSHLFIIWLKNKTRANAQAVLDLILNT